MGQEYSSNVKQKEQGESQRATPPPTQESVSEEDIVEGQKNSHKRDIHGHSEADSISSSPIEEDIGIVEVVKDLQWAKEKNEMLQRLHRVQKFEPFLKETGRSFSFESLLGMGDESREISSTAMLNHESITDILVGLQTHINTWMMDITADQRLLLQRIKHVDEMSVRANQIVVGAALQSKTVSDKLNQVKSLKIQAQQVHLQTSQLMSSLAVIHKHFPAECRLESAYIAEKWPVLTDYYQRTHSVLLPCEDNPSNVNVSDSVVEEMEDASIDPALYAQSMKEGKNKSVGALLFTQSATVHVPAPVASDGMDVEKRLRTLSSSLSIPALHTLANTEEHATENP